MFLFNSKLKFINLSFYVNFVVDKLIDDNMYETNCDKRVVASCDV